MIDIIVQRGDGDIPGDDVVDSLITTVQVALARGTYEIDECTSYIDVSITAIHIPNLKTGDVIEVVDFLTGLSWRGKIVTIEISLEQTDDGLVFMDTLSVRRYNESN